MSNLTTEQLSTFYTNAGDNVALINKLAAISSLTDAQKERIRKLFDGIIIVAGIIAIVGLIFGIIVLINSAS